LTGTNVLNIGSIDAGAVVQQGSALQKQNSAGKQSADFSALMTPKVNSADTKAQTADLAKNNGTEAYDRYQYRDNSVEQTSVPTISDKIDSAKDELSEFEEQTVALVGESLGADEDQVKQVLEELGMTAFDLLNPQNLAAVVQELTGTQDSTQLLLSSDFQQLLGEIGSMGSELMNRLNLQMNQMDELVSQLDLLAMPEELQTMPADNVETAAQVPLTSEEPLSEDTIPEETIAENPLSENVKAETKETEDEVQTARTADSEAEPENSTHAAETVVVDERSASRGTKEQTSSGSDQGANLGSGSDPMTQNAAPEAPVSEVAEPQSYTSIDTLDLIEQVAQNVKVVLANDSTSMEMQLNPENLGKIYLNVSTKEGVVNAQIAAQNEAVKVALETQLATLRENLNQAGIKVDSIEVTVASHEFEKNLEQDQHRNEQQETEESGQPAARRNIRMDSLDELSGLMTEEEALVAQIMKDNGNSVDLTA
jgi:flagellar hook-length control protein FliK